MGLDTQEEFQSFFDERVYVLDESNHSGVLANVGVLNMRYKYDTDQRMKALIALEQYADHSLTAYNAIEVWSMIPDGWWIGYIEIREEAKAILKRVVKPTQYLSMKCQSVWVDVK